MSDRDNLQPRDESVEPSATRDEVEATTANGAVADDSITVAEWPEQDPPPAAPTPQPSRAYTARGAMIVGARVVAGTVGIAATIATVAAAALLPLPSHVATPPSASVVPVPAAQQRVCAGPLLRLGDDLGVGATTAFAVGSPTVRHVSDSGSVEESRIEATDEPSGRSAAVLSLTPDSSNPGVSLLAASQSQSVDTGDLVGFAAAECAEARSESWLVGGATTTGRTTLITLANPGNVEALVDLTIYSPEGEIDAPGAEGIAVQPRGERILSLAGLAPGLTSPVIKVVSSGGQVVANLQQSTVRTLEPGGVDIVGATESPATKNVITGLVLSGHELIEERSATGGYEDLQAVVRFFVPGDEPAAVQIRVDSASDDAESRDVDFDLMGGRVTELPLSEFADGSYTVTITSDVPIVAGARVAAIASSGVNDFVWMPAAPAIRDSALVRLAPGPGASLHLYNPTSTDAEVTIDADGEPLTATVPAEGVVAVPASGASTFSLSGFDRLRIAVSYFGDGVLSGFVVSPTGPAAKPITVFP